MNRIAFIFGGALALSASGADSTAKVDFQKQVWPILEKSCIKCHGPEKQKGKLRLDSKEVAFKNPDVIKPGKADESELYKLVILPADNDDRMPNEGDPLTKAQTDLLRDWINQGAEWPEHVAAATEKEEKPASGLAKLGKPQAGPNEAKAIAKLEALGGSVRPIAMNVNWQEANLGLLGTNVNDATLAIIKDIPTLVHLNLRSTRITDAGLANLKGLTNLLELHLEKTSVTDAGLVHLKDLTHLNYLNLYGTKVSDAGLEHLKGLRELQSVYLWQSQVTSNGVDALKKALPHARIDNGADLTLLVKKEENAEKKKEESKKEEKEKKK
jgi:hypothetical protein